jgi:hypothetical protein
MGVHTIIQACHEVGIKRILTEFSPESHLRLEEDAKHFDSINIFYPTEGKENLILARATQGEANELVLRKTINDLGMSNIPMDLTIQESNMLPSDLNKRDQSREKRFRERILEKNENSMVVVGSTHQRGIIEEQDGIQHQRNVVQIYIHTDPIREAKLGNLTPEESYARAASIQINHPHWNTLTPQEIKQVSDDLKKSRDLEKETEKVKSSPSLDEGQSSLKRASSSDPTQPSKIAKTNTEVSSKLGETKDMGYLPSQEKDYLSVVVLTDVDSSTIGQLKPETQGKKRNKNGPPIIL